MDNEKMRVRYGRLNNRTPKNTLVTVIRNGVIYFGISRCNRKLDTFHKQIGKHIAFQRAELVGEDLVIDYSMQNEIIMHKSGLRGYVKATNIKNVVEHFRSIDEFCLNR